MFLTAVFKSVGMGQILQLVRDCDVVQYHVRDQALWTLGIQGRQDLPDYVLQIGSSCQTKGQLPQIPAKLTSCRSFHCRKFEYFGSLLQKFEKLGVVLQTVLNFGVFVVDFLKDI